MKLTPEELEIKQVMLEQESVNLGRARYQRNLDKHNEHGNADMTVPARILINRTVDTLTEAIEEDRNRPAYRGRYRLAVQVIQGLESGALAYITLRAALSLVTHETTWTVASNRLGKMIQEEARMQQYLAEAPDHYELTQIAINRKAMRAGHINVRHTHTAAESVGIQLVSWSPDEIIHVGSYLLDILCRSTGLFSDRMVTKSRLKTVRMFLPEPELSDWMEEAHDAMAEMTPVRLPMVHPPKDWTNPWDGGYLTDLGGPVSVLKSHNQKYLETLEQIDMPDVYNALNALQKVQWRVNKPVLDVALAIWDEGIAVGSLGDESMPAKREFSRPPVPNQWEGRVSEWKQQQPEEFKKWCRWAAEVHKEHDRRFAKRIACQGILTVARKMADEPVIYFPHAMDFRGRVYPIPSHLQPQGSDLAKGILTFANGKRLGSEGVYWLKVHIANCFGVDKVSFDERIQWVDQRSEILADSGLNPLDGDRFWLKADSPFQALAACMEYAGYLIEGEDYVSHIPVGMDGSCNGLQNFSAMLRDPVGGKATNLVPADKPADIYTEVMRIVAQRVRTDAEAGVAEALPVDGYITRKLVKQPVMTLPYGATKAGMRSQIETAIRKLGNPMKIPGDQMWNVCGYLAEITYEAIGQVVVAAVAAMDWLQQVAKIAGSDSAPVSWTSPIGLPVLQEYRKYKGKPLRVHIRGKKCKVFVATPGSELDKRKQALGIAPNFVHSCDASHMCLTTLYLVENGIESIGMVHDSFATHAADVSTLHTCLRMAFIDMYSADILGRLRDEMAEQLPEKLVERLPPVPDFGNLDLEVIMDSPYFFA